MKIQEAKWSQMESEERSLQIYDSFFIRHYENLINSLERRDDTYYIVSLTRVTGSVLKQYGSPPMS